MRTYMTPTPGILRIVIIRLDAPRIIAVEIAVEHVSYVLAEYETLGAWRLDRSRGTHGGAGCATVDAYKAILEGRREDAAAAALWIACNAPDRGMVHGDLRKALELGGNITCLPSDELMTSWRFWADPASASGRASQPPGKVRVPPGMTVH
jgi:hypothetical protein